MPNEEGAARVAARTQTPAEVTGLQPRAMGDAQAVLIERVAQARDRTAILLADGELWILPIFERLEQELDALAAKEEVLTRARQIAAAAARKRAA